MFVLESHLSADQSRALAEVREAAEHANLNLFLTGGAMRDMMGGFAIRDLDFTLEGQAVKFAKALVHKKPIEIISVDENRKSVELRFPGDVLVGIGMARQERYSKPGGKPQVQSATIQLQTEKHLNSVHPQYQNLPYSAGNAQRLCQIHSCRGFPPDL